ncbi:hypothetical protein ABAC460_13370 [Asticcacaulis sp. AC460]|uniref:hypothetical protein n=1 Tax=Asticcacaulis sp. AC460 TaxID=1282360 RepID=UPI0003C3D4A8|nr:hypothetical protein [Asticcacaulis sp. AC460]ESQ89278.1 hypothetical protein ABAC460_13370 [Asticcacaulis sp. AC460]
MKRMALVLAAALAAVGVAQARAQDVPPEVVDAVQAIVADGWLPYDASDPENSGPPPPQPTAVEIRKWQRTGLLKKVNVTPAKAPDWMIDSEKTEYPAGWCGTGGCMIEVWSPDDNGHYVRTFRNQVRLFKVRRIPGKDFGWIETDFHGSACGLAGVEACPWGFEWRDDGLGKFAMRASWRFTKKDLVRTGVAPQAIDTVRDASPDTPPPPMAAVMAANTTACASVDAKVSHDGAINRTPDLNGDGIDDWSYDGYWMSCYISESATGDLVVATTEDGTPVDYCPMLDCGAHIWVSLREGGSVTWQAVDLNPQRAYGIVYRVAAPVQLVELRDLDGVAPDSTESCDTFFIKQCVLVPISLSPKP